MLDHAQLWPVIGRMLFKRNKVPTSGRNSKRQDAERLLDTFHDGSACPWFTLAELALPDRETEAFELVADVCVMLAGRTGASCRSAAGFSIGSSADPGSGKG
jgi:hypothetical protein